jgi:hypothetical protein
MALYFDIHSDLYVAGKTEDGQDYTAEVYFVFAEDEHGNRWRHHASFAGCKAVQGECEWDGAFTSFEDIRPEAKAKAERLLKRIHAAGGRINQKYWSEDRPAYGSKAYQDYGMHDDWMEEQRERHGMI